MPTRITTAGISILRQRVSGRSLAKPDPPTAKGVMFLTLEDETGFIRCIVPACALRLSADEAGAGKRPAPRQRLGPRRPSRRGGMFHLGGYPASSAGQALATGGGRDREKLVPNRRTPNRAF